MKGFKPYKHPPDRHRHFFIVYVDKRGTFHSKFYKREKGLCKTEEDCQKYFKSLCRKHKVGKKSLYLCSWY